MKDALILEHKTYISAKRAAEITGYTSDYVGQLCRAGKIVSKIVGRSWFVLEESLLQHKLVNDEVKTNKKTAWKRRSFQKSEQAKNLRQEIRAEKEAALEQSQGKTVFLISERAESLSLDIAAILAEKVAEKEEATKIAIRVEEKTSAEKFSTKPVPSPFAYSHEPAPSPLIPLLKKKIEIDNARVHGQEIKVRFVPAHFSIRGVSLIHTPEDFLDSENYFSAGNFSSLIGEAFPAISFAIVALFVVVAGSGLFFKSSILAALDRNASATQEASVASISENLIQSAERGFEGTIGVISNKIALMFSGSAGSHPQVAEAPEVSPTPVVAQNSGIVSTPPASPSSVSTLAEGTTTENSGFGGLAVVPSTNSPAKDALIKQQIKDSFSDEVQVHPDQTGTSGIITPVFKKATGDNFVYVLVPIAQAATQSATQ